MGRHRSTMYRDDVNIGRSATSSEVVPRAARNFFARPGDFVHSPVYLLVRGFRAFVVRDAFEVLDPNGLRAKRSIVEFDR